jgi:hypothetical protein
MDETFVLLHGSWHGGWATELFARAASQSPDNTVECPWEVFRDLFI